MFEQDITANLPTNTQFLSPRLFMNNGATAAAVAYERSQTLRPMSRYAPARVAWPAPRHHISKQTVARVEKTFGAMSARKSGEFVAALAEFGAVAGKTMVHLRGTRQ